MKHEYEPDRRVEAHYPFELICNLGVTCSGVSVRKALLLLLVLW